MIKIVAEMSVENSTVENLTTPLSERQEGGVNDSAFMNAIPITAILLAIVASCNSGKIPSTCFTPTVLHIAYVPSILSLYIEE